MVFLENSSDPHKEQSKKMERFPGDENRLIYSVFEQIQIGIAIVDARGMCLKVNPRLCEILDHSESELLGSGFKRIIFTKEPVLNSGIFNSVIKVNSRIHYEEKLCLRKDGEKIWIGISVLLSINRDNNSFYFIYYIEDMTRQKEIELALQSADHKFKGIFENANDGITISGPNGRFLKVNNITCKKLGYNEKELLQKKAMDVISSYASKVFIEQLGELYRCGHVVIGSEVVSKNGICMPVELSMSFIEYRGKPAILSIMPKLQD